MKQKNFILLSAFCLLLLLSVTATYYKTITLADFKIKGISLTSEEGESHLYFVYENIPYEIELERTDYNTLIENIASELGKDSSELDVNFLEELKAVLDTETN